jgi:hypothetical protein
MLELRRSEDKGLAIFAVSGRFEGSRTSELQKLLDAKAVLADVTLDSEQVRPVDRETVRLLGSRRAAGNELENCPSYIRRWLQTGSDTSHEPRYSAIPEYDHWGNPAYP